MLKCNIGWTRRGVPFWEENRSDGMVVPSWSGRSGPIPKKMRQVTVDDNPTGKRWIKLVI